MTPGLADFLLATAALAAVVVEAVAYLLTPTKEP